MSIDKVRLTPALAGALYKNIWTVAPQEIQSGPKDQEEVLSAGSESGIRFLGNHARKVTLVVDNPGQAFVADQDLAFLIRIFEACRMSLDDLALVNLATQSVTMPRIQRGLAPAVLMLFGMEATAIGLPFQIPLFKIQEYNGCRFLCLPPLVALNQDSAEAKLLKSRLWLCLKDLFGV